MTAEAFAPAKINLCLHVTGRRPDGYHLLDSLVAFAAVGDRVTARHAAEWTLAITGPFGDGLGAGEANLVLRAARLAGGAPAALTLDKRLPVAGGLGGGSADAAATLRALHALDGRPIPQGVVSLGADVPVCLSDRPRRMRGIGEVLDEVPALPPAHLCLVNPGRAVSTPAVFGALAHAENAPLPEMPALADTAALAAWLGRQRNDLEAPARGIEPAVGVVLSRLAATEGCLLARMSGSGGTCFGLYASRPEADAARRAVAGAHPGWWAVSAALI
jgi:4-diphosphocytidyl-2-C-methyl-D-erythritol kinase